MELLVYAGTFCAIAGLAGILSCAWKALGLRKLSLSDAETRDRLNRLLPINFGSLAVAAIGLMLIVVGILL